VGYTPFNWCERCGAAAQGIGEAIPKHTVAPWRQHFGGSPRRLNKPAVYDHTGRKHATKIKTNNTIEKHNNNDDEKDNNLNNKTLLT